MKAGGKVLIALLCLFSTGTADAGGLGRFVGALVARGAVRGAVIAGRNYTNGPPVKNYTTNILTVDQLVQCLRKANVLDGEFTEMEAKRERLKLSGANIDQLKAEMEVKRSYVNQYSQESVDRFNREIESYNAIASRLKAEEETFNLSVEAHNSNATSYNTECAKSYYGDDMEAARKIAGI